MENTVLQDEDGTGLEGREKDCSFHSGFFHLQTLIENLAANGYNFMADTFEDVNQKPAVEVSDLQNIIKEARGVQVDSEQITELSLSDLWMLTKERKLKHEILPAYPSLKHNVQPFLNRHFSRWPQLGIIVFSILNDTCSFISNIRYIQPMEDSVGKQEEHCLPGSLASTDAEGGLSSRILQVSMSQHDKIKTKWIDLEHLIALGDNKDPAIFFFIYPEKVIPAMDSDTHEVYERLVDAIPSTTFGMNLSRAERAKRGLEEDISLIYGEICPEDFSFIFKVACEFWSIQDEHKKCSRTLQSDGTFYDLGSGLGLPSFIACMLGGIKRSVGIELLEDLYNFSVNLLVVWESECKRSLQMVKDKTVDVDLHFCLGNILEIDWTDGAIIFMHSTCFDPEITKEVTSKAEQLQPGSIVISVSEPLFSETFQIIFACYQTYSWGDTATFVQKKLPINC